METAASAVRNLNNHEINGRTIRVAFADQDAVIDPKDERAGRTQNLHSSGRPTQILPNLPVNAVEAIAGVLNTMNANQLFDLMTQMKMLVQTQPDQARMLMNQNPQLSWALFQAMLMMGVIPPSVAQQIHLPPGQAAAAAPMMPMPGAPPMNVGGYGRPGPPGAGYAPPPPAAAAPPPMMPGGVDLNALPDQQRAALMQLMQLTNEQIDQLPPAQRQQILALKAQFMR